LADGENDDPPDDHDVDSLELICSKAIVGKHFVGRASQEALAAFVADAMIATPCKLKANWARCVYVAKLSRRFLGREATASRALTHFQLFEDAVKLAIARKNMWDGMEFTATWQEQTAALMRSVKALDESLRVYRALHESSHAKDEDDEDDADDDLADKAEALLDHARGQDLAIAKAKACEKVRLGMEAAHKVLETMSRGDHERTGKSWLEPKAVGDWNDWDELTEHYKLTLKLLKASDLTTAIAAASRARATMLEVCGFFDVPELDVPGFEATFNCAVVTKMEGCMMKALIDLDKDGGKREIARAKLRAEIKEAATKLNYHASSYGKWVPAALAKKAQDCIAMRP